ncbi:MAG TPA: tetratricopeptide repeat protein [Pyrinomonadaceae bacterium]
MKSPAFVIVAALLFLLTAPPPAAAATRAASDDWLKVRSRNFLLVGNASEREIRLVATRLEQFREVFKRLLASTERFDSAVPTTVVVFRDDLAYRPFEPLYQGQPNDVAGYFQSSNDVNYITLSADGQHVRSAYALAFHEYVHLLVKNSFGRPPLWLNEGLAEYYSAFEIADGNRKVKLGLPLTSRVLTLRRQPLLPLTTLFGIDEQSPSYNEPGKRDVFYAESWALVHYLLNGRDTERRSQLLRYLDLIASGQPNEEAFRQAFHTDISALENELRQHVQLERYAEQAVTFAAPLEFDTEMTSAPLTAAETQFYLGDLLLHTSRIEVAEAYLLRAIELDKDFAPAHAALGQLRARQNRFNEAIKSLERAVALDPQNYLARYYYADALSHEGLASDSPLEGSFTPERFNLIRAELKKAIELAPRFIESYRLLAFVSLVMNEQLEEAGTLLQQAIKVAPQRWELAFLLAQLQLRREDFQSARNLLSTLIEKTDNTALRQQAQALLETVSSREETTRRLRAAATQAALEEQPAGVIMPCDAPQPGPQKKPLRFSGEQICGMLVRVECEEGSVVLAVEVGGRTLKLRNQALNRIRFVTYTADVKGQMTCGQRQPATPVLVTYRSAADAHAQVDGEVLAVEFIPKEWNPAPPAPAAP